MIPFLLSFLICLGAFFRSRYSLSLEILALRQQLGVLKRKHPRPRLLIHESDILGSVPPSVACVEQRPGHR